MQKFKTVDEFLKSLDADKRAQIESLRSIITETNPDLAEIIKWNAPSYVLDGQDRITFNTLNKEGVVKLVLHMGASRTENKKAEPIMSDPYGLIVWNSNIRGMLSFQNLADIESKRTQIAELINSWLAIK